MSTRILTGRMYVRAILSAILCLATTTRAFLSIPYNTTHSFGPDGPWLAASIGLKYLTDSDYGTVNVYPGNLDSNLAALYVPTQQACANDTTGQCAAGGTVGTPTATNGSTWYTFFNQETGYYFYYNGTTMPMDALLPQGITYLNTVVDVCKIAQVTYPSGKTVGVEVGLMSLGGSPLAMQYNPPLTLYVNGLTSSNTFGLHIGSAQYNYTGSLIFGGYDRGRVIGPVLSYDARSALGLLDINIRVETGASPFSFESRDNLLQTPESAGITQPVQSFLKPEYPYMFLPQLTIEAIANNLPIHFDSTSGFWLWDTKDPNYKKIVSSPAYLGFVFPSLSGNTLNETIKVSFSLLNLDLESSVSGLDSTVKYFPVMRTEVSQLTAYPILLGRAFMQATFTGTNWSKNISWLAQAPGPGATREGLGYDPIDLDNGAQTLDVQTGDNLFSSSWAGHWTVLSADGSDDNDGDNNGNGLSGGAIAGIVVGVVGGLAIIGGIIAFLLFRRRRRTKPAELQVSEYRDDKPTQLLHEAPNQNTINELDTSKWHEADGTPHSELPGNAPAELPATNK